VHRWDGGHAGGGGHRRSLYHRGSPAHAPPLLCSISTTV